MIGVRRAAFVAVLFLASLGSRASAQRVVTLEFEPVERAQLAIWIADESGNYLATLGLTSAVALRGIGNRPGASMMNSGFRWPYGRREGVLPVWAHARAAAPDAELFPRVIFQDRISEGHASRSSNDSTRDDYYCLSFMIGTTGRDALDAISCASVFMSDKGRYITESDVAARYFEPQEVSGAFVRRDLDPFSLYPPRRDVTGCTGEGCVDHPDVARFRSDADRVMPELDAITMATPPGGTPVMVMFTVPEDWADGTYQVFVEANVEGDWNDVWGPPRYPTPTNPTPLPSGIAFEPWDYWAMAYGYPYRGQPSVVYRATVAIGPDGDEATVAMPVGYGSLSGQDGSITPLDATMTNDPVAAPGSGVDRLGAGEDGVRLRVRTEGPTMCETNLPPSAPGAPTVSEWTGDYRDAHRFAHLSFSASSDDAGAIRRYEVRVARAPIEDLESFLAGVPANAATLDSQALQIPTGVPAGEPIAVDLGGLSHETHYWIGVRAIDRCNAASEIAVAEHTTPAPIFTTVSPCFVATAAYGSPMAAELAPLRRVRDRHLMSNAVGRAFVSAYYELGPHAAAWIAEDEDRRAAARALLCPIVDLAAWLTAD
jgi:hypothetical protein